MRSYTHVLRGGVDVLQMWGSKGTSVFGNYFYKTQVTRLLDWCAWVYVDNNVIHIGVGVNICANHLHLPVHQAKYSLLSPSPRHLHTHTPSFPSCTFPSSFISMFFSSVSPKPCTVLPFPSSLLLPLFPFFLSPFPLPLFASLPSLVNSRHHFSPRVPSLYSPFSLTCILLPFPKFSSSILSSPTLSPPVSVSPFLHSYSSPIFSSFPFPSSTFIPFPDLLSTFPLPYFIPSPFLHSKSLNLTSSLSCCSISPCLPPGLSTCHWYNST